MTTDRARGPGWSHICVADAGRWRSSLTFVIVSIVYSLWWNPVVHHSQIWVIPGDIWSTFRAAHWVGWGNIGGIYGGDTQLVTFPGIAVLLAPLAMVSGGTRTEGVASHRSSSASPTVVVVARTGHRPALWHRRVWWPSTPWRRSSGSARRRRIVLSFMEAVVIFQVVTIWGHPEDVLALALALYALLATFRGRWSAVRMLWGAAIVGPAARHPHVPLGLLRIAQSAPTRLGPARRAPFGPPSQCPTRPRNGSRPRRSFLHQANSSSSITRHRGSPCRPLDPDHVGAGPGRMIAVGAAIALGCWA